MNLHGLRQARGEFFRSAGKVGGQAFRFEGAGQFATALLQVEIRLGYCEQCIVLAGEEFMAASGDYLLGGESGKNRFGWRKHGGRPCPDHHRVTGCGENVADDVLNAAVVVRIIAPENDGRQPTRSGEIELGVGRSDSLGRDANIERANLCELKWQSGD